MTQSLLISALIILSEIIVVLLILYYFGIRHYLKLKEKTHEKHKDVNKNQVQYITKGTEEVLLTDYLKIEIERTTLRLKEVEQSDLDLPPEPLKRRLELLLAERQVNEAMLNPENKNKCWNIVNAYYEDNAELSESPGTIIDKVIGDANSESEEIDQYKAKLIDLEGSLQEANGTIDALTLEKEANSSDEVLNNEINRLKLENEEFRLKLSDIENIKATNPGADKGLQKELQDTHEEVKEYARLVSQANKKINKSSEIIGDLKEMVRGSESSEDLKKMERMIDRLTDDNVVLKKKLEITLKPNNSLMQVNEEKQALQEELCMYMDLVIQANEKLKESNLTIDEFKHIISSSESSEELQQIQEMVDKLNEENMALQSELKSNGDKENISVASDNKDENSELGIYKDLVKQANDRLKESNETIEELRKLINASPPSAELDQMESMIEKLSQDNTSLLDQINALKQSSQEKLESILKDSEQQQQTLNSEINMYKDLFCQANDKLKESNETIEGLRNIVDRSEKSVETEQMQSMLDKLTEDNNQLGQKLESVHEQLDESLLKIAALNKHDVDMMKELEIIKEEKWFLEEQIKHLSGK